MGLGGYRVNYGATNYLSLLGSCSMAWHAVAWRRVEFNDSVGLFTGFAKRVCHAMRGTCGMQREGMRAAAPKPNWRNSGIVSEA